MFSMLRTYCLFRTFLCYELDVSYENVYFLFSYQDYYSHEDDFQHLRNYAISKTKHLLFPYIWLSLFFLIITFPIYAGHIDEASRGPLFIKIENTLNLVGITSNFICSLCAIFFQNLHIGKFFYMGNSIMVRFYSMDC